MCRNIIEPTEKLQKYLYCIALLILIYISLFVLNYFYVKFDETYFNIYLSIILLEIIITKYYQFVKIVSFMIFLCFVNNLMNLGLFIQNKYSIKENKLKLFYILFSFFIYILSILILFQAYKEMKAIFIEEYGNGNNDNEVELKEVKASI